MATFFDNRVNNLFNLWHQKNIALDRIFYDVDGPYALEPEEKDYLLDYFPINEGAVLIVPPSNNIKIENKYPKIKYYLHDDFIDLLKQTPQNKDYIDTVVVAGVGNSALGTAALGRAVSNHLQRPVAGIVSGFGLEDVLSEGLGGYFGLGVLNAAINSEQILHEQMVEQTSQVTKTIQTLMNVSSQLIQQIFSVFPGQAGYKVPSLGWTTWYKSDNAPVDIATNYISDSFVRSQDVKALKKILLLDNTPITNLIGHSRGNIVISKALFQVDDQIEKGAANDESTNNNITSKLKVLTLGAVIKFPSRFSNVSQYLGAIDTLGKMNSRNLDQVKHQLVPNAWHTLNQKYDGYMPVNDIFTVEFPV